MPYDADEHAHRFAVWAGARAAQRGKGGFEVGDFRDAMVEGNLRESISAAAIHPWTHTLYTAEHDTWCQTLVPMISTIRAVDDQNVPEPVTYGRVAKALNVYVKTMYVIGSNPAHQSFIHMAHPPVDRKLLKGVRAAFLQGRFAAIDITAAEQTHINNFNAIGAGWTSFDGPSYRRVVDLLKKLNGPLPFWMIEKYWQP